MAKCLLLLLILVGISLSPAGAQDTLVVYDLKTQTTKFIPPVPIDPTVLSGRTESAIGAFTKIAVLPQVPPSVNVYPQTLFSKPQPAVNFVDVTTYPVRTSVSIQGYVNGKLVKLGSGSLIGENVVLTAAHVVYNVANWQKREWHTDTILVIPAYNNGQTHPHFPGSLVTRCFIFKTFYENTAWHDLALLELQKPIGRQTGYVGLGFQDDTSFFRNKVFHKFSYPAAADHYVTPPRIYNGDTLFYNYGLINAYASGIFGMNKPIGVTNGWGIPGQSGSSLLLAEAGNYYSFGVLNWSTDMLHSAISRPVFFQFHNVMQRHIIRPSPATWPAITLFPNPFRQQATLLLANPDEKPHSLTLYNSTGKLVRHHGNITGNEFILERGSLNSGLYFYQIGQGNTLLKSGKVIIE